MKKLVWFWFITLFILAASPSAKRGTRGMVASRSALASQVGATIMKGGGNAVDAAVAVGFALAVTYPSAGNIGGGGFMVIRTASGEIRALDFRETAPAAASRDMYLDEKGEVIAGLSTRTHQAAGVPGSVAGLLAALEKYGSMSREEVMAPAIKLAREGFMLTDDLAEQFQRQLRVMAAYPASMAIFSKIGKPYKAGDLWKQLELGDTLERISREGRDGFYKGRVGELIVAEMKRGNGRISLQDLAGYQVKWRDPVHGTYRGYDIWSMPPPSSGGVLVVQMLNMLEAFDVRGLGWGSAALVHGMVEAQRRAYADRAEYLGDPDFVEVPMAKLMDKSYAKQRFKDFDPARASDSETIGAGSWPAESMETTHYSVMDGKGNAVACTTTLNWGYGSKIVVAGTGFLLNNEMDDFSVKTNTPNSYGLIGRVANEIQPAKRMLSSMTPTIVTKDGQPVLLTGSPGGSTIINTVLQVIVNVIDHGMDITDAVSLPRFHHQWKPNRIIYEPYGLTPDTLSLLVAQGHQELMPSRWKIGDANSILVKDGMLYGMSDPRNKGGAAGF